jgi:creatinine amidohydrolase/Fe(II)-dependent formamide hydrolase-like protein
VWLPALDIGHSPEHVATAGSLSAGSETLLAAIVEELAPLPTADDRA